MPASALLWHRGCAAARAQTLILVTAMAMASPTKAGAYFCTSPRTCSSCLTVPPSAPAATLSMPLLTDTYDNTATAPSSAKAPADHPSFTENINKYINKNIKQQKENIQMLTTARLQQRHRRGRARRRRRRAAGGGQEEEAQLEPQERRFTAVRRARQAKRGRWRKPLRSLASPALWGGCIGPGLLG